MGAFASLTIPLDLSRPGIADAVAAAAERSAGSTDAVVDTAANELRMKLQLPGNLNSLMMRLAAAKVAIPLRIGVSVPVRSLSIPDTVPDTEHLLAELNASGIVSDATISGDTLTAMTTPSSKGLYMIYLSLIHHGLMAQDTPTLVAIRGL